MTTYGLDRDSAASGAGSSSTPLLADGSVPLTDEWNTGAAGLLTVGGAMRIDGVLTPAQITSSQNDYNPTGLSAASFLRLSSDTSRTITGLAVEADEADGRILVVHNVGAQDIILADQSASSTAAYRFDLVGGNATLSAGTVAVLHYDNTSARWRVVSGSGAGAAAAGDSISKNITSAAHGWSVGDVLYHTGSGYALADASSTTTAEVVGMVIAVPDTDTFTLLYGGYTSVLTSLTAGAVYFLSETAGDYTATEPTTVGTVSKPLFIALSTTIALFFNMRGSVVGAASSTLSVENFSGDASTVNFTLASSPLENNTFVMVEGVYQQKNTYSISGTTLTFSTAPPTGTNNIEVVTVGSVNIGTPSDSTVGQSKLDSTLLAAWPDGLNTQVGLLIKNDGTNPNYQLRITCTEIVLKDTSNLPRKFSSWSNALVDITASGAAGLDTGAEATSTWYYIWLIAKEDGTKSQILSASATSPTLPSGYTYKARVGAIYNKSSGHFTVVRQYGRYVLLVPDPVGSYWTLVGAAATTWTDLSSTLTTLVPSIAESYSIHADNSAGAATYLRLESGGVTPSSDYQALKGSGEAAGCDNWLPNTQVLFYAQSSANNGFLAVNSYRL